MSLIPGHKRKHAESRVENVEEGEDCNPEQIPTRLLDKLFCSSVTLRCALNEGCIPCAYKIGAFDVALDTEFTRLVPNRRPEECSRAKPSHDNQRQDGWTLGYRPGMSILTVGDGDFSFSLALARLMSVNDGSNKLKKKKLNLVATSYETEETLRKVYHNYDQTAKELVDLGATLAFQVDATQLSKSPIPKQVLETKFDRVCWNFPCTAIQQGQDGQNDAMERNKQLVRDFVENATDFLKDNGEIHMSHKTKPPFNQWKIETVAVEKCQDRINYCGRVVLDRCLLPPYQPRKALHRKSFPCHDACIYIFQKSRKEIKNNGMAPTIPLKSESSSSHERKRLVPVTRELIGEIRSKVLAKAAVKKRERRKKKKRER